MPELLAAQVRHGVVVAVPLQKRLVSGVVLEIGKAHDVSALKRIHSVLDATPTLNEAQLELARWISEEYYAPLGRCCALMVPPGFTSKSAYVYALNEDAERKMQDRSSVLRLTSELHKRLYATLQTRGPITESKLRLAMKGVDGWRRVLGAWVRAAAVTKTSTLQPPKVQPQRSTLAQLAIGEATLQLVLADLDANRKLQTKTRARRAQALSYLQTRNGLAWADWIFAETGATRADLSWLAEQGYVILGDATRWRDPLADIDYIVKTAPPLTEDQHQAWEVIRGSWRVKGEDISPHSPHLTPHSAFLLRGVTGSGKTEIYMRAVDHALQSGKSAIVLVPEISLTPQTARRFLERFPGRVALIHSKLKPGERYDTWRRIRAGEFRVVVGARSALFAPVSNLGLIVLDEEHDPSYKQGTAPMYDARRVAQHYASRTGATVIFGSATPSLESLWRAEGGQWSDRTQSTFHTSPFTFLELPNRVRGHVSRIEQQGTRLGVYASSLRESEAVAYQPLPNVQVIDMRAELRGGNTSMFSGALHLALGETLRRGEQAILFLNRRGAASSVICRDCGHVLRCPNDDTPLTLHAEREGGRVEGGVGSVKSIPSTLYSPPFTSLKCHQCDHTEDMPARCPTCGSGRIRHVGIGTQRVEQAIHEQFPTAKVVRWDRDSASKTSAEALLGRFVNQQANVLIGTQMIAKGLDLPLVTLVGVVLADVGLFLPDFRASERVFNLIEQVAGRAGRGLLPGRVIVQTYNPTEPPITFAARHDVQGFARYELTQRRRLQLPPYVRLVRFEFADADNDAARKGCELLARQLRAKVNNVNEIIGPASAYFTRRNKLYRWQVIARTHSPRDLLEGVDIPRGCVVDVDPVTVL